MEDKVTIYTEGTGWIEIDIPSFYKTQLKEAKERYLRRAEAALDALIKKGD